MGPLHPYVVRPPARTKRTESKAVLSLVLGLLSMGCIGPIAGVPAIILGSIARRDIDRSNGQLGGRAVAAGGIVSGLFGTGLGVVLVHICLWLSMRFANAIHRVLKDSGTMLVSRIAGLLLAAIAVQLLADAVLTFARGV